MTLVVVPNVIGLGRPDAEATLDAVPLRHIAQFPFAANAQGIATEQDPPGGALIESFSVVTVSYPSFVGGGIPDSPVEGPDPPPIAQFQQLAVKVATTVNVPYQDNLEQVLSGMFGSVWDDFVAQVPFVVQVLRMYDSMDAGDLSALQDEARAASGSVLIDLLRWFRIPFPISADAEQVAAQMRTLPFIEQAFVETHAELPTTSHEPQRINQHWQDDAPTGVGANRARDELGGLGAGVNFVDVEYGWRLDHEDLADLRLTVSFGDNATELLTAAGRLNMRLHGTPVLAIVAASENGVGGVGLAPQVNVKLVSGSVNGNFSLHGAIIRAIQLAGGGGILLIELQGTAQGPIETNPIHQMELLCATALGVTVIEPAGNGQINLDEFRDLDGKTALNRASPDFIDSGAVVVGAATSTFPHTSSTFASSGTSLGTSFGNRVDCYCWGDSILAASGVGTNTYGPFGGTSGASAIVAGVAACVQGMALSKRGVFLTPFELRMMLSSAAVNTRAGPGSKPIGVMPDLAAIAAVL